MRMEGGDIIFNNCLCDLLIQVQGVLASGRGWVVERIFELRG